MKKSIYTVLAVAAIVIVACKKETTTTNSATSQTATTMDQTKPVITLNGAVYDTILLDGTYTDPGTVATDDTDGDISAFVVVSGNVNANAVGDYTQTYNVKDAAGNAANPKIRYIHVRNAVSYIAGTYTVSCQSQTVISMAGTTTSATFSFPLTVITSTISNGVITFSAFPSFTGMSSINAGQDLTCPAYVSSNTITGNYFNGGKIVGLIAPSKNTFTLNTENYLGGGTTNHVYNTIVAVKQ